MADSRPWLVCQIGAREHYVLARELLRRGLLSALITDAWAPPTSLAAGLPGRLGRRLAERYVADLAAADVVRFTGALLQFELFRRLRGYVGWDLLLARNRWFGRQAVRALARGKLLVDRPVVFAYSYGAHEVFEAARAAGCTTVLGQIDPAVTEEDLVADAVSRHPGLASNWQRAPTDYWQRWRKECALADRIVVNSEWAREGLLHAGIAADKLRVVPLAYEAGAIPTERKSPAHFDECRPLRVLFLGSFILRKGAAELLEAARLLRDRPVEFHIVGASDIRVPEADRANPRLLLHGAVSRQRVHEHFEAADLFILPTLSDGFGLTLLEAQAHGLPVITSRNCGEVVRDGIDGMVLEEVSGVAIADAVTRYIDAPTLVAQHRQGAPQAGFSPSAIGDRLLSVLS